MLHNINITYDVCVWLLMTFPLGLVVSPWFKIYKFDMCVHRILQRVRLANRGRLLLRTSGPVPFGTCICSNVETIFSWTCHVDLLSFEHPSVLLFCFRYTAVALRAKVGLVNQVNHNSWVPVGTWTSRSKFSHSLFVIERFVKWSLFGSIALTFNKFSPCWYSGVRHRPGSDLFANNRLKAPLPFMSLYLHCRNGVRFMS